MKITNQYLTPSLESELKKKSAPETGSFSSLMAEHLKGAADRKTVPTSLNPQAGQLNLNSSAMIGQLLAVSQTAETTQAAGTEELDGALNLLEQYAAALADPGQTLKSMAPLADKLEVEAEKLAAASQKTDDPALKSLYDQTAITAAVEAMKFKRGDYI